METPAITSDDWLTAGLVVGSSVALGGTVGRELGWTKLGLLIGLATGMGVNIARGCVPCTLHWLALKSRAIDPVSETIAPVIESPEPACPVCQRNRR